MRFEKWAIAVASAGALFAFLSVFPMPSWWMRIDRLDVHDSAEGQPIIVGYDRTISRDFDGKWRVSIWRSLRGEWSSYCTAEGVQFYRSDSVLPEPVTLEWLAYTRPRCYTLPKGVYQVAVHIEINPDGFWHRTVDSDRDTFEVR